MYNVDTTIQANSSYNVPIITISGYVTIACFYFSGTEENVVYPNCPKQRTTLKTELKQRKSMLQRFKKRLIVPLFV